MRLSQTENIVEKRDFKCSLEENLNQVLYVSFMRIEVLRTIDLGYPN